MLSIVRYSPWTDCFFLLTNSLFLLPGLRIVVLLGLAPIKQKYTTVRVLMQLTQGDRRTRKRRNMMLNMMLGMILDMMRLLVGNGYSFLGTEQNFAIWPNPPH